MKSRNLLIGPGRYDWLPDFEILDIAADPKMKRPPDHIADATKPLPFADGEFDLIYASHIIEHIPWYDTVRVLKEWHRILKTGGKLEIWVPNAYELAKALIAYEDEGIVPEKDGHTYRNKSGNPYLWVNNLMHAYSKPRDLGDVSWHRAHFTPKRLRQVLYEAGFAYAYGLDKPRGFDHGWINLGVAGIKGL